MGRRSGGPEWHYEELEAVRPAGRPRWVGQRSNGPFPCLIVGWTPVRTGPDHELATSGRRVDAPGNPATRLAFVPGKPGPSSSSAPTAASGHVPSGPTAQSGRDASGQCGQPWPRNQRSSLTAARVLLGANIPNGAQGRKCGTGDAPSMEQPSPVRPRIRRMNTADDRGRRDNGTLSLHRPRRGVVPAADRRRRRQRFIDATEHPPPSASHTYTGGGRLDVNYNDPSIRPRGSGSAGPVSSVSTSRRAKRASMRPVSGRPARHEDDLSSARKSRSGAPRETPGGDRAGSSKGTLQYRQSGSSRATLLYTGPLPADPRVRGPKLGTSTLTNNAASSALRHGPKGRGNAQLARPQGVTAGTMWGGPPGVGRVPHLERTSTMWPGRERDRFKADPTTTARIPWARAVSSSIFRRPVRNANHAIVDVSRASTRDDADDRPGPAVVFGRGVFEPDRDNTATWTKHLRTTIGDQPVNRTPVARRLPPATLYGLDRLSAVLRLVRGGGRDRWVAVGGTACRSAAVLRPDARSEPRNGDPPAPTLATPTAGAPIGLFGWP